MPWEKAFDVDAALDRATEVFWAKGYEGTSMADLMAATDLTKGSLYNAFGSKKALFTKGLLKYDRENRYATLAQLRTLNDPIGAISQLFDGLIEESLNDDNHKGCLLINTALDLPNQDQEIQSVVKAAMDDFQLFFQEQIESGQRSRTIPQDLDPSVAAHGLLTLVAGLRVLARGVFNVDSLKAIKAQALNSIQ